MEETGDSQEQQGVKTYVPEKPGIKTKIKGWLREAWRVLRVTKKPDMAEFKTIVKISGVGILIIGLIGFVIHLIKELLF